MTQLTGSVARSARTPFRGFAVIATAVSIISGTLGSVGTLSVHPAGAASAPMVFTQVPGPLGVFMQEPVCPSASSCYVEGVEPSGAEVVALSTNGGINWQLGSPMPSAPPNSFGGMGCASTTTCYVALSASASNPPSVVEVTTNSGQSWSAISPTIPTGIGMFTPMACPAVGTCFDYAYNSASTGGVLLESTDGGLVWTLATSSSTPGIDISCPSTTMCLGVSTGAAVLTTNGGAGWSPVAFPSGFTVEDGQCPTSTACFAIGASAGNTEILSSSNGGVSWSVSDATGIADGKLGEIVCSAATACTAQGGFNTTGAGGEGLTLWSTQDGGGTWQDDGETTGMNLSCPTSSLCLGADSSGHIEVGSTGASPISGSAYSPVAPYRITDTRTGSGQPNAGHLITSGGVLAVQVAGTGTGMDGVPATGATAVALNITAVGPTSAGYLTVWPTGVTQPVASNLNFTPNETIANLVVVPLGTGGQVSIFSGGSSVNVVVDVAGWFGPATPGSSAGQYLAALAPTRITDTRAGSGQANAGATLPAGGSLTITGFSTAPVVASSALALNVTVTNTKNGGFLTVYPAGTALPLASNLNWSAGATVAGRVFSDTNNSGSFTVYNGSSGTVDVIVDESGWFTDALGTGGGLFTPVTPVRIADTRSGSGEPYSGQPPPANDGDLVVATSGTGGIPNLGIEAAMLNLTVTNTSNTGYLTAADDNTWLIGAPSWSDLNWLAGQTVPNSTVADVGSDGAVDLVNGSPGSVAVIVDISGWFS